MDVSEISDQAKEFLQQVVSSGEKWMAEELKEMLKTAENEKDFLEDSVLFLTRVEIKVRNFKQQCEKIIGMV